VAETWVMGRVGSAPPEVPRVCCYCGRDGVIAIAFIWMVRKLLELYFTVYHPVGTFCIVVISAASYWLHLVHTKNEQKTLLIAQQARDFYSITKGVWNAGLISAITSSFINLIVSVLLAYGAYFDKNKLLMPWMVKNMLLLVVGAGFGFYNIYWVASSANTEDESSFWGSLCGLYWVILVSGRSRRPLLAPPKQSAITGVEISETFMEAERAFLLETDDFLLQTVPPLRDHDVILFTDNCRISLKTGKSKPAEVDDHATPRRSVGASMI
ncbi:unnamed protein product, partial [Notodromas monacha]